MNRWPIQREQQLHRMALKRCIRCGVRLCPKQTQNLFKYQPPYLACEGCRKKDRERKRV